MIFYYQLDQNQETDVGRIYDINLHAEELTLVPKLDKVCNLYNIVFMAFHDFCHSSQHCIEFF